MNPHRTQVAAVRLRNALTNLLKEIGQEHYGWHLEPPPEEMTKMSCVRGNCEHKEHWDDDQKEKALAAARDEALLKAKLVAWGMRNNKDRLADHEKDFLAAITHLTKLEQPADPLDPVREFVAAARRVTAVQVNGDVFFYAKLKAAEKALGMEP